MKTVTITIGDVQLKVECLDTPTARAVAQALPFESRVHTWGDEVYFEVPVGAEPEADAKEVVEAGEIAFWCQGRCIAIGYGPTPISQGDEIRLAARTNIWARALTDVKVLKKVKSGDAVYVQ